MTTRQLTAAESAAFRLARLRAADQMPYFARALFAVVPLAAPGLGTFAVDAHWRLYMDPELLAGAAAWAAGTAGGVLLHEANHLLRQHAARADALPQPRVHLAWNLAGDAEINDDLIAAGAPLPAGVVTPGSLGLPDRQVAEDYYAALARDPGTLSGLDDGGPGCGSGGGGPSAPGELPAESSGVTGGGGTGLSDAEADLIRRLVAADIKHCGGGRGTVPAGLDRWADGVLAPPVISWSRVLRAAIRRAIADQAGRTDYTYARPARRRLPGIIRPAMRGPSVVVSVVVDTSGSMSQADLDAALSEIAGVLTATGIARDKVTVLACDAAASQPRRVRTVRDVRLAGGGGTDMTIGIAAACRARPTPHVVIVLTDGDTPWPASPVAGVLVCAIISPAPPQDTPPWAVTVHIPA
jgi:predicted metal-dependent peptidase